MSLPEFESSITRDVEKNVVTKMSQGIAYMKVQRFVIAGPLNTPSLVSLAQILYQKSKEPPSVVGEFRCWMRRISWD
ncbi:hypothetical protein GBA52_005762 [Prunus armeniaca]|nr:hypothetical protein GBA52_005762 [Prunus armeniaca]